MLGINSLVHPGCTIASRCVCVAFKRQVLQPASCVHRCPSVLSIFRPEIDASKRMVSSLASSSSVEPRSTSSISLYNEDVAVYDRVFSDRSFKQEAEFLVKAYEKHAGQPPQSSLEIGCGPARHATLLAKQWGLRTHALDNSSRMLSFARKQAEAAGADIDFIEADMRDHVLTEEKQVDLAFMLCGTLSHLLTNSDALECFASAAKSLRPNGCLVLEMVHPEDLFGGTLDVGTVWDIPPTSEHCALSVSYGSEADVFDPLTQTINRTVEVTEWSDESGDNQVEVVTDTVPQRFFTSQEVDLLARASGLKVVGTYGNLSLPFSSTEDEDTFALVMVLQKL